NYRMKTSLWKCGSPDRGSTEPLERVGEPLQLVAFWEAHRSVGILPSDSLGLDPVGLEQVLDLRLRDRLAPVVGRPPGCFIRDKLGIQIRGCDPALVLRIVFPRLERGLDRPQQLHAN